MALNHDENRLIPAAPSSWSVELSSTWTSAQHVCNNPAPDVRWYLSSHICCTPSGLCLYVARSVLAACSTCRNRLLRTEWLQQVDDPAFFLNRLCRQLTSIELGVSSRVLSGTGFVFSLSQHWPRSGAEADLHQSSVVCGLI